MEDGGSSPQPLAPANRRAWMDDEEDTFDTSKELRRKKRMKWLLYFVVFVVFQTGIILLFTFTVMKVRTPKFRVQAATFESFTTSPTNATFNLRMNAQLRVKNTNFGNYKYQNSTISFFYRGNPIGEASVPNGRANLRSTKKINIAVDLTSTNIPSGSLLGADLNSGVVPLTSQSSLKGKVTLMFIFKKKKETDMNCTMDLVLETQALSNVVCK